MGLESRIRPISYLKANSAEVGAATMALVADSRRDFASLLQARLLGG